MITVPVNEPLLDGNEKRYLAECIDSGWISSEGPFVQRFEAAMAASAGRAFGIAVCNGSAALEAAVAALRIGPGDEVILPAFTIISCAAAVVRAGAVPVLVDSDPLTWCMDARQIESKITPRTRAIMVVHIYGLPVDMAPVLALAERHGLQIIEDAAEAHGLAWRDRPCGSFGAVSAFSFYPNKLVTTGEGGMLVTDDAALADRCRALRNLCFRDGQRFVHEELGWNLRMSNLQAAVGVAQLERLDQATRRKKRMGRRYSEALQGLAGVQLPCARTDYAENLYWVYGLVLDDSLPMDASGARSRLAELGVATRPFFWPLHEQPVLTGLGLFGGERYPVAERLARRGFYLPSGLALTDAQMDQVVTAVRTTLA
ncbi:MAG: DegT/DnrJ/EryC1/StrS family aminotransferase [Chromatiales bacterium]|nr:DegT/DnrJ/EryC1/StrS family aminotransferase [Chromatiales bacterium]